MTGVAAMADALLQSVGGRQVSLRIAAPAVVNDPGEQLGLSVPQYQDLPLGPAVFRKVGGSELLVSGSAVAAAVGTLQFNSAQLLLEQAVGLVIDGRLFQIESIATAEAFGAVYLYRISLRAFPV